MLEKEVWGVIPKELYETKLSEFKTKYGNIREKKRLDLRLGIVGRIVINTRVRIEKNKLILIQKTSENEDLNSMVRQENEINIEPTVDNAVNLFEIFKNLLNHDKNYFFKALQFENIYFDAEDFEIKLTHQFGLTDIYSFEIEVSDQNLDPVQIAKSLGLEPDLSVKDDNFWIEYSNKVNLDIKVFSASEVRKIVEKYL